jgi:hypothetical protein
MREGRAPLPPAPAPKAKDPAPSPAAREPGQPLPSALLAWMEPRLGHDFAGVRVHADRAAAGESSARGARAFAAGDHVHFGPGAYAPHTTRGRMLLAHELTHVAQQRRGGGDGSAAGAESEAARAGVLVGLGGSVRVAGGAPAGTAQLSPKSDEVAAQWKLGSTDKGKIFDLLRAAPQPAASTDADLAGVLDTIFKDSPDDLWLAQTIRRNGPEPLWPLGLIDERVARAAKGAWPKEAGNIEASLPSDWANPFAPGTTAGLAKGPGGAPIKPSPVKAYFFPGRSAERALVIGGVHGSEQSGIEVVEKLRASLASAARAPYFTTILVPVLFPDNDAYQRAYVAADPARQGKNAPTYEGGRYSRVGGKAIEPNRNLPRPGESLATGQKGLKGKTTGTPLKGSLLTDTMLPENVMLVALIEHFKPSRIASVHAHSPSTKKGDAPGIYVDPRGGIDSKSDKARTAEGQADDKLVTDMLAHAKPLGLKDNPGGTVHYASAKTPAQGTSLGDWAPVAVDEGKPGVRDQPGDRPAITTVTVEVENYWPSSEDKSGKMKGLIEAHRSALQEVFLEK